MIKNLSALEVKVSERIYKLLCEQDSPLGEVHDVLCNMKNYIVNRINDSHKAEQPPEPEVKAE